MLYRLIKSSPMQIFFALLFVCFYGENLSLETVHFFYSLSIGLKDILLWGLPLVIGVFIATTLQSFEKKAIMFVCFLMIFEALSNASSVLVAYGIAYSCESIIQLPTPFLAPLLTLKPFLDLAAYKPSFWSVDKAVIMGVVLGVGGGIYGKKSVLNTALFWMKDKIVSWFLGTFIKLIPLYVFGFLLYMKAAGLFTHITTHYGSALMVLGGALAGYLLLIISIAANFKIKRFRFLFSTLFPTGVIAFTSMSSAATMPVTIKAAEKNLKNPLLAGVIIPATTNIQQVGDCLANAMLCLILLKTLGTGFPSFSQWLLFTTIFVGARFTTVGTMGGAIFIMIPIYEKYLGFTPEMSSLMIALNVILDPFITAVNVVANGALCVLIEKIWGKISKTKSFPSPLKKADKQA